MTSKAIPFFTSWQIIGIKIRKISFIKRGLEQSPNRG